MSWLGIATYNLGSFLQTDKEIFGNFGHISVSCYASSFIDSPHVFVFPVNAALDLSFEVAWVLAWQERHLDVAVGVGLQFALHWFQEKFITTKKYNKSL